MAFGNNLYVCQNAFNSEQYFVVGKHYEEFCNYWQSGGEGYVKYEIEHPHSVYIRAADIEGIGLSEQEVQSASLFWGNRTGETQETFQAIAAQIPQVKNFLDAGESLIDICLNHPELERCVSIYFEDTPSVTMVDDFYVFSGGGRHREMAAKSINGVIPVKITGIVKSSGRVY